MDTKLPDREQLLADVFDIVRQHQPVHEETLMQKIEEQRAGTPNMDVSIVLCMLQARGLVQHFTVEVDRGAQNSRKKRPYVEFKYRVVEQEINQEPEPMDSTKPGLWARIFG